MSPLLRGHLLRPGWWRRFRRSGCDEGEEAGVVLQRDEVGATIAIEIEEGESLAIAGD